MAQMKAQNGVWRLLIVDDEEAARYGMLRALGSFGYEIAEAGSVEAARALMQEQPPDLLLLDVNLPGTSGLDFLRELKESTGNGPLVIIITAHGSDRSGEVRPHQRRSEVGRCAAHLSPDADVARREIAGMKGFGVEHAEAAYWSTLPLTPTPLTFRPRRAIERY